VGFACPINFTIPAGLRAVAALDIVISVKRTCLFHGPHSDLIDTWKDVIPIDYLRSSEIGRSIHAAERGLSCASRCYLQLFLLRSRPYVATPMHPETSIC
jgi:hypothetical protein